MCLFRISKEDALNLRLQVHENLLAKLRADEQDPCAAGGGCGKWSFGMTCELVRARSRR